MATNPRAASTLRLAPALLRLVWIAAGARQVSVNAWINDAIQGQLLREAGRDATGPLAAAMERRT